MGLMAATAGELVERFWTYVDKTGGDDACWPWSAGTFGNGYGQFRVGPKKVKAHRFAYESVNGPIPDGMIVCHRCDHPPCCNPAHLFIGTAADNAADRDAKGRGSRKSTVSLPGALNPAAKLTWTLVRAIRARYAAGERPCDIADAMTMSRGQIRNIVRGRSWRETG